MDENRLIMLILIALFVIGVLSLVAIHFSLSGSADKEAGLLPSEIAEPQPYDSEEKEPAVPSVIETLADPVDAGKKPSPIHLELSDTPKEKSDEPTPVTSSPESPPVMIMHEKDKPNGTFFSAQEISQGIVEGQRGTKGDQSDFFKIRATGRTMILKLEPFLDEKNRRFKATVFHKDQKKAGEISSEKAESTKNLAVEPQTIYYIMLDLSSAPIQSTQYRVHVSFN